METETLSKTKIEQLNEQPIIKNRCYLSIDGKWFVNKTTITTIKPVTYINKILEKKSSSLGGK
jgi:hypothetical protein